MNRTEKIITTSLVVVIVAFIALIIVSAVERKTKAAVMEGIVIMHLVGFFFAWRWIGRRGQVRIK